MERGLVRPFLFKIKLLKKKLIIGGNKLGWLDDWMAGSPIVWMTG